MRPAALLLTLALVAPAPAAEPFRDVPQGHPAREAIEAVVDLGLLSGYEGKFHGEKLINRYQVAVIVKRTLDVLGLPSDEGGSGGFPDVPRTHWSWRGVQVMVGSGIYVAPLPYKDGTDLRFHGEKLVNRLQMAVLGARLMERAGALVGHGVLPPDISADHPQAQDILTTTTSGLFPYAEGRFEPEKLINRYQMARTLQGLVELAGGPARRAAPSKPSSAAAKAAPPPEDCISEELGIEMSDENARLEQQLVECKRARARLEARVRELEAQQKAR
jgi:hypothetical protein